MTTTELIEVDEAGGREVLDNAAERLLGISGVDFLKRWDDGAFDGDGSLAVMKVAMLIPFAR
jgi:hypothetical protein